MSAKAPTNVPRWIRVETEAGPVPAITFVLNRKGRVYAGKVSPEETANLENDGDSRYRLHDADCRSLRDNRGYSNPDKILDEIAP
jgi:hypothetical protein